MSPDKDTSIEQMEMESHLEGNDIVTNLQMLSRNYPGAVCLSTGFGLEGQVLTHMIFSHRIPIKVFTLDTGRMFSETYAVWSATEEKYGQKIIPYYPDAGALQQLVAADGPNGFYCSPEARKNCCRIRKVDPLKEALAGQKIWISGLRAEQSDMREQMQLFSFDISRQLYKYHPLFYWSEREVKEFIRAYHIPYHPLYDRGFKSIGCAPCTRAVAPDADMRSGRWWWEDNTTKECGIHLPLPPTEPQAFTI